MTHLRTRAVHAGQHPDPFSGAIATPIWGKTRKEVDTWDAAWSRELKSMYQEGFTRIKEAATAAGEQAQPASTVAHAVAHALRSRWPKTRYRRSRPPN